MFKWTIKSILLAGLLCLIIMACFGCGGEEVSAPEEGTITIWAGTDIEGTYTGQLVNGIPGGYGIWEHQEGHRYEGDWKDGQMHGQGIMTYSDGTIYEGELNYGQMHGQGKLIEADGTIFEGRFEDNLYVGE